MDEASSRVFNIKEGIYNVCLASNEQTSVDKITMNENKKPRVRSEVRCYIHDNNDRTKSYSHVPALSGMVSSKNRPESYSKVE